MARERTGFRIPEDQISRDDSSDYSGLGGWRRFRFSPGGPKKPQRESTPPVHEVVAMVVPPGYQREGAATTCEDCELSTWFRIGGGLPQIYRCRVGGSDFVVEPRGWCPSFTPRGRRRRQSPPSRKPSDRI